MSITISNHNKPLFVREPSNEETDVKNTYLEHLKLTRAYVVKHYNRSSKDTLWLKDFNDNSSPKAQIEGYYSLLLTTPCIYKYTVKYLKNWMGKTNTAFFYKEFEKLLNIFKYGKCDKIICSLLKASIKGNHKEEFKYIWTKTQGIILEDYIDFSKQDKNHVNLVAHALYNRDFIQLSYMLNYYPDINAKAFHDLTISEYLIECKDWFKQYDFENYKLLLIKHGAVFADDASSTCIIS